MTRQAIRPLNADFRWPWFALDAAFGATLAGDLIQHWQRRQIPLAQAVAFIGLALAAYALASALLSGVSRRGAYRWEARGTPLALRLLRRFYGCVAIPAFMFGMALRPWHHQPDLSEALLGAGVMSALAVTVFGAAALLGIWRDGRI